MHPNEMNTAQFDTVAAIAPQPSTMKVDIQSRLDWLLSKELVTSEFEKTLDRLVGDGQNTLAEFMDWRSSGATYTFNELRNELCSDVILNFDASKVFLFGLFYSCKNPKRNGLSGTVILMASIMSDIQNTGRFIVC